MKLEVKTIQPPPPPPEEYILSFTKEEAQVFRSILQLDVTIPKRFKMNQPRVVAFIKGAQSALDAVDIYGFPIGS